MERAFGDIKWELDRRKFITMNGPILKETILVQVKIQSAKLAPVKVHMIFDDNITKVLKGEELMKNKISDCIDEGHHENESLFLLLLIRKVL